ncbi:hypothetical protein B1R27_00345 [Streptomyces sp. GKU 895]|nr:hypothetical protein B1R27_00345 [Streptomyces sp. GKU 895]
MALMTLDPTGKGRKRWTMRCKAPLAAFQIAFEGRLTPSNNWPSTTKISRQIDTHQREMSRLRSCRTLGS